MREQATQQTGACCSLRPVKASSASHCGARCRLWIATGGGESRSIRQPIDTGIAPGSASTGLSLNAAVGTMSDWGKAHEARMAASA